MISKNVINKTENIYSNIFSHNSEGEVQPRELARPLNYI